MIRVEATDASEGCLATLFSGSQVITGKMSLQDARLQILYRCYTHFPLKFLIERVI